MGRKNTAEVTPAEQIKVDIPNGVPLPTLLHKNPQVLDTGSCLDGQNSIQEVKEDTAGVPGEQTIVDIPNFDSLVAHQIQNSIDKVESSISDSVSLFQQIPAFVTEATISFHNGNPTDLVPGPEGQQTSFEVANGVSRVASQSTQAVSRREAEILDLKTETKVATWVTMIASGGIVSEVSGILGNEKTKLTQKVIFKAFTSLNYVSLVLGVGLFLLTFKQPNIPGLVAIVKFTMWIALGLITYALGLATCILFPAKLYMILVLLVPVLIAFLVVILSFGRKN